MGCLNNLYSVCTFAHCLCSIMAYWMRCNSLESLTWPLGSELPNTLADHSHFKVSTVAQTVTYFSASSMATEGWYISQPDFILRWLALCTRAAEDTAREDESWEGRGAEVASGVLLRDAAGDTNAGSFSPLLMAPVMLKAWLFSREEPECLGALLSSCRVVVLPAVASWYLWWLWSASSTWTDIPMMSPCATNLKWEPHNNDRVTG